MQRFSFWLVLLLTLYVSACSTATRTKSVPVVSPAVPPTTVPAPIVPGEPILSTIPPSTIDLTDLPTDTTPLPPADNFAQHIALILPLKSAKFSQSADAVQQGFLTAANNQPRNFPVRVYPSADEGRDVIEIYRQAIANGAVGVAGPLTRAGVTLLAGYPYIAVPTLALNTTEQKLESNKLFFYGLIPEAEARQAAQLAYAADLRDATIINTATELSKRYSLAFSDEWKKLGGNITAEISYKEGDDNTVLIKLPTAPWLVEPVLPPPITVVSETGEVSTIAPKRTGPPPVAPGNVAFLASDHRLSRLIRPYLNPSLPVYGTSQLFNIHANTLTNYDLNEVHFTDMPWLLQPDHAAVMIYPRSASALDTDKERLYAFGIDAYRLLYILLNAKQNALPLDGVTGRIRLAESNLFQRDAVPALFKYGRGLTPETLAVFEAEKAAARAADIAARKAAAAAEIAPTATTP